MSAVNLPGREHWGPFALIAAAGLLVFGDLALHPSQCLYSDTSDVFAEHLPAKDFLVRSFQETGELPAWCPYLFSGSPFLHDLQVAAFYPPHLLLLALPPEHLGAYLSWITVGHVLAAGWLTYLYARSQGLGRPGAVMAGWGWMFAGRWMLHLLAAGHYITIGLAWVPLVLLLLDRAMKRGSLAAATGAGIAFALLILCTHPQWTLYAGILIACWSLGPALERAGYLDGTGPRSPARTARELSRGLGYGLWAAAFAVALAAVQLLPTAEMARHTSRSAGVATTDALGGGLRTLTALVGPILFYRADTVTGVWEDRGGLGLWWLAAALLAPFLAARRRVRYQAAVGLGLLLFAVGGAALVEGLPGFQLFRQPQRMMVVVGFPVAILAGVTTDAVWAGLTAAGRDRGQWAVAWALGYAALTLGMTAGKHLLHDEPLRFHVYWATLPVTGAAVVWLFLGAGRAPWVWSGLLLIDLLALAWPLVAVRPQQEIYPPSAAVDFLAGHHGEPCRVLDRDRPFLTRVRDEGRGAWGWRLETAWGSPLGPGTPLAPLRRIEAVRGYNPMDLLRYKEYLQFLSGTDEPLKGLSGPLTFPILANFLALGAKPLFDLLGVRYVLWPGDQPFAAGPAEAAGAVGAAAGGPFAAALAWGGAEVDVMDRFRLRPAFADPAPAAYNLLSGGVFTSGPYVVWENATVLPRAFVVPEAAPLPDRPQALPALLTNDFRGRVLLEGWPPAATATGGAFRPVAVTEYLPNRVTLDLGGGPGGYLVLTDVWFPGWSCTVDGVSTPIHRANFLFRGVAVPAGARVVAFRFAPDSLRWGWWISLGALAAAVVMVGMGRRRVRAATPPAGGTSG